MVQVQDLLQLDGGGGGGGGPGGGGVGLLGRAELVELGQAQLLLAAAAVAQRTARVPRSVLSRLSLLTTGWPKTYFFDEVIKCCACCKQ